MPYGWNPDTENLPPPDTPFGIYAPWPQQALDDVKKRSSTNSQAPPKPIQTITQSKPNPTSVTQLVSHSGASTRIYSPFASVSQPPPSSLNQPVSRHKGSSLTYSQAAAAPSSTLAAPKTSPAEPLPYHIKTQRVPSSQSSQKTAYQSSGSNRQRSKTSRNSHPESSQHNTLHSSSSRHGSSSQCSQEPTKQSSRYDSRDDPDYDYHDELDNAAFRGQGIRRQPPPPSR